MAAKLKIDLEQQAEKIRDSIILEYKALVDKISEAQFDRIKEAIEEETGNYVEMTEAVKIFKANLMGKFEQKFKNNWEDLELSQSLAILEFSKLQNKSDEKKWRPTAQPVENQVLPLVYKKLLHKKKYILTQLMFQNQLTAELIPQVEQFRSGFKELIIRNRQIHVQIETDGPNLARAEEAIKFIQSELASKTSFEAGVEQI